MAASSLSFALATWSEQLPDWIEAHSAAYTFLGGVMQLLISDNTKCAVIKACHFDPLVNRSYMDMARHYKTAVFPARPQKPRDKAKVENCFGIVERWLWAGCGTEPFIVDLNKAIADLITRLNDERVISQYGKTRRALFEELDAPNLKPLRAEPWVQRNGVAVADCRISTRFAHDRPSRFARGRH